MRVLTYLHSFEPGGLERDVLRFNAAWQAAGIDVRVVVGRRQGRLADSAPDLPYVDLPQRGLPTRHFETLWMVAHLPAQIRAFRPDVLFCAGNSYTVVAVAVRLLMGRHCPPIVFRVSNDLVRRDMPWPVRKAHSLWLRLQAPLFAAIVAMATPARAEILREMRADPSRVVAIDNASLTLPEIDRLARHRAATPRQRRGRHWLGVGRLVAQKNFRLLIDAFADIAGPDDRLTILGEGNQRAMLERRAAILYVGRQVSLPGHASSLDDWLADADALVLSSDYEGLGIVILEALASGVPVVATDCGPNMAALLDGVGRLVPVRDRYELGKAMVAITRDPVDVGAMRARARQFTVESATEEWAALFGRLAQQPRLLSQR